MQRTATRPLHDALGSLAVLVGTWAGEGHGVYPTIEPFDYREEARYWHNGKPFLFYAQRTWSARDGAPLHAETGFLRALPEGRAELVVAHPFGIAEVSEGEVVGSRIELRAKALTSTSSADSVAGLTRIIEVTDAVLSYAIDMAASGLDLQRHLTAELRRVPEPSP